jgi:hypothetical protein
VIGMICLPCAQRKTNSGDWQSGPVERLERKLEVGWRCAGELKTEGSDPNWNHSVCVITLDDGETIHNAFFDRDYDEDAP